MGTIRVVALRPRFVPIGEVVRSRWIRRYRDGTLPRNRARLPRCQGVVPRQGSVVGRRTVRGHHELRTERLQQLFIERTWFAPETLHPLISMLSWRWIGAMEENSPRILEIQRVEIHRERDDNNK